MFSQLLGSVCLMPKLPGLLLLWCPSFNDLVHASFGVLVHVSLCRPVYAKGLLHVHKTQANTRGFLVALLCFVYPSI